MYKVSFYEVLQGLTQPTNSSVEWDLSGTL